VRRVEDEAAARVRSDGSDATTGGARRGARICGAAAGDGDAAARRGNSSPHGYPRQVMVLLLSLPSP